jgi:hypothetical protein
MSSSQRRKPQKTPEKPREKPRTIASQADALLVLGAIIALGIAETAARVLVPRPPTPRITEPAGFSPFEQTPQGLHVYKPGATFSHIYDVAADRAGYFAPDGRIQYRINNLGFRGEDIAFEKPPGVRRILCLGDSFTFGEGAREPDTWPRRLETILGRGSQVINAGVQGYGLDHEGLYLFVHGRSLRPDVVVLGFFMNDAMPFNETVAHQALLDEAPAEGSLFSRVSALWRFLARGRVAQMRTHQYLDDLRRSFSTQLWSDAKRRIPRLREMADHDGFRIVVVIFPLLYRFDDYPLEREHEMVRRAFGEAGIEVVDLLESYRSHKAEDLWAHVTDPHPNERAHAIAAERLARGLDSASPASALR